jgi:hypothetical protein
MVIHKGWDILLQCDGGEELRCQQVFHAYGTLEPSEARLRAEAFGWVEGLDDAHQVSDYCPKCAPKL